MTTALIQFEEARCALDKAYRIDEVKQIRDQAQAAQSYARQARESVDMQMQIAEIKLRAERKAGELLREMEKAVPRGSNQHGRKEASHDATHPPALEDLGITRSDSSRWQQIADIPEPEFEAHLCEQWANRKPATTAGTLRLARNDKPKPKPRYPVSDGVMKWLEDLVGFTAFVRTETGDRTFDEVMLSKEWDPAEDTFAVELLRGLSLSLRRFHEQAKSVERPDRKRREVDTP